MARLAPRVPRDHCLAAERVAAPTSGGRYRSLFPDLPPLRVAEPAVHALGRAGGPGDDARGARADLEGLYGAGPAATPYLYRAEDPAKLLRGPTGRDLPRNQEGVALAGDPRNDVQLFTSQMAAAFIELHNRLVNRLREDGVGEAALFAEARQATTWHHQQVILREFLPGFVGHDLAVELLERGSRLYRDGEDPFIPLEFADAAYRYGHAQIRDRYRVNEHFGPLPVFPDLMGFGPVPVEHSVDWAMQIDVEGHAPAQRSKRIDPRLPAPLIALPTRVSGSEAGTDYASLATRDLQRGRAVGLASGETPLWFYVLREADVLHDGDRLGPVGGRIVGEVLVGIIDADPASYRSVAPDWAPTLPSRRAGAFGLADILVPLR